MKPIMLDTDVSVEVIRGRGEHLQTYKSRRLVISAITRYELRVGAEKADNRKAKRRTKRFLDNVEILEFGPAAADRSGTVRARLEKTGNSIGPYDYLIAGHALSTGCAVLTANVDEFRRVRGLEVLRWHPTRA